MAKKHITLDGEIMKIKDLSTSHLINIIAIKSKKTYSPNNDRHNKRLIGVQTAPYIKELNKRFNHKSKSSNKLPIGMYSEDEVINLLIKLKDSVLTDCNFIKGNTIDIYYFSIWVNKQLKKIK